jgi:hypothetical protein
VSSNLTRSTKTFSNTYRNQTRFQRGFGVQLESKAPPIVVRSTLTGSSLYHKISKATQLMKKLFNRILLVGIVSCGCLAAQIQLAVATSPSSLQINESARLLISLTNTNPLANTTGS